MVQKPSPLSLAAMRREARREQALRDNLHKRKAQSRGRDDLETSSIDHPATKQQEPTS
jgi:hypothetical protein